MIDKVKQFRRWNEKSAYEQRGNGCLGACHQNILSFHILWNISNYPFSFKMEAVHH